MAYLHATSLFYNLPISGIVTWASLENVCKYTIIATFLYGISNVWGFCSGQEPM